MPDTPPPPARHRRVLPRILGLAAAAAFGGALLQPRPAAAYWVRGGWVATYPYYGWAPRRVIVPPPVVIGIPPPGYPAPVYVAPRPVWVPGYWRSGFWVPGHWR